VLLADLESEEYATAFDASGRVRPVDRQSALYVHTRGARTARAEPTETAPADAAAGDSAITFFPPHQPVGALSVRWTHTLGEHQFAESRVLLHYLGELAGAAIGNVLAKLVLEEKIAVGEQEAEVVSHEHAMELHRRDEVEQEKDRIAVTDVLTGLLNRRGFFLHAEQSFKLARREGATSAVIFADIDGLKTVNDTLGHETGDRLICSGGELFAASFRGSDITARLGGDEFVAFTLDAAHTEAILARIQQNIDAFNRGSATPYRISFSIGIVRCDPNGELGLADYLSQADKQMYETKKGRLGH
jgi:diguanylate cyclase (GGDEF)-like protein